MAPGEIKVADKVPTYVPNPWTKTQVEDAIDAYERSIQWRRIEFNNFEAIGGGDAKQRKWHLDRIQEEVDFLQKLYKRLPQLVE